MLSTSAKKKTFTRKYQIHFFDLSMIIEFLQTPSGESQHLLQSHTNEKVDPAIERVMHRVGSASRRWRGRRRGRKRGAARDQARGEARDGARDEARSRKWAEDLPSSGSHWISWDVQWRASRTCCPSDPTRWCSTEDSTLRRSIKISDSSTEPGSIRRGPGKAGPGAAGPGETM